MYVELFGLPGSGKTTLSHALTDYEGVVSIGVESSYRDTFAFLLLHPVVAFWWMYTIVRETVKSKTWKLFRFKLSMVALAFARVQKARRVSAALVLIDEGLLQRVLSVYEHRLSDFETKRALHRLALPSFAVCVAPREEFSSRLIERKNARSFLGPEYVKQWEAIATDNYSALLAALMDSTTLHHIHQSGDDTRVVYDAIRDKMRA